MKKLIPIILISVFLISCEKKDNEKGGTIILQSGSSKCIDAYIWNLAPDATLENYFENSAIAWTNAGRLTITRALMKFDLTVIRPETDIHKAEFYLYGYESPVNGTSESLTKPNYALLCRVTSPWQEHSVTWNNQPSFDISDAVLLDSCNIKTDYVIDVTEHVRSMIQNPSENYGWILKMQEESYYRRMILGNSDNEDPSIWPKLVIEY